MFYDRKIKYLDYYENGERVRGCGFIKIEVRDNCLQIDLSVTGLYPTDAFERDILFRGENRESSVGKIVINGGKGQFRQLCRDIGNIGNSGISYEEWKGIRIPLGTNREISGRWEKTAVVSGGRREMAAAEIQTGKKRKGWTAGERVNAGRAAAGEMNAENTVAERVNAGRAAAGEMNAENTVAERMNTGNSISQQGVAGKMAAEKMSAEQKRVEWETAGKAAVEWTKEEKMAVGREKTDKTASEGFQAVQTASEEHLRYPGEKSGDMFGADSYTRGEKSGDVFGADNYARGEKNGDMPGTDRYARGESYSSRSVQSGEGKRAAMQSRQDTRRGSGSRKESINDRGTENEKPVRLLEDKWQQIYAIYPHIHPFRDEREYISIRPADFVLFPAESYKMVNNSFLLHGYYNYRHLLLAKVERKGEVRYYIGVPGNFYEKEKQVAIMFGFESFECAEEPAQAGDFGYYMMRTEL